MKELLTPSIIFNQIAMLPKPSCVIVLEGEDDALALRDHALEGTYVFAGVGGRSGVLEDAERALREGLEGIIFLIDRDFDSALSNGLRYPSNVIASVSHDFFTDIILGQPDCIKRILEIEAKSLLRSGAIQSVEPMIDLATRLSMFATAIEIERQSKAPDFECRGNYLESALQRCTLSGDPILSRDPIRDIIGALRAVNRGLELPKDFESACRARYEWLQQQAIPLYGDHLFFKCLALSAKRFGLKHVGADRLANVLIHSARDCDLISNSLVAPELLEWLSAEGRNGIDCFGLVA